MGLENIDWQDLRQNKGWAWHRILDDKTLEALTSSDDVHLVQFNQLGYFHIVRNQEYFKQMKLEWEQHGRVPREWIAKGGYPGIWTAMFDPHNTYSRHSGLLSVVRFYFNDGYIVYNEKNPNHTALWENWEATDENPWESIVNERSLSLKERMEQFSLPSHKKFYEQHRFGAVIGYSDYTSPVIVLEDSVAKVEFLEF